MIKKTAIETVDIWDCQYWPLCGYLKKVGFIDGKTVFRSTRGFYYFLTDSRYEGTKYYYL